MMRIASSLSCELHPRELGPLVLRCATKTCGATLPGKRYAYCLACRRVRAEDEARRIAARKARKAGAL